VRANTDSNFRKEMTITINSEQVVLITGSSTGFGRLFTDTLARKGHTVPGRDPVALRMWSATPFIEL
jgi:short-subunit dehydrogenase involved in D-alanine esterification of teichoic acids